MVEKICSTGSRSAGTITEKPLRLMNNRLWLYRPLYLLQFYRFYFRIIRRPGIASRKDADEERISRQDAKERKKDSSPSRASQAFLVYLSVICRLRLQEPLVNGINQRPTKRQITHNRDDKNSEQIQQTSLKLSKDPEIEGRGHERTVGVPSSLC
jgi:hypothetical protein